MFPPELDADRSTDASPVDAERRRRARRLRKLRFPEPVDDDQPASPAASGPTPE